MRAASIPSGRKFVHMLLYRLCICGSICMYGVSSYIHMYVCIHVQSIADREALNLEIISEKLSI